jgi:PKHD-type hydroxylase
MAVLNDVLTPEELTQIRDLAAKTVFQDGKATAGEAARKVKDNLQAVGTDPNMATVTEIVLTALRRHPYTPTLLRPRRWSKFMLSKYSGGQEYGFHTDNPQMKDANGGVLRTDLSFTLFLSDPATYDGGGLIIREGDGDKLIKLPAGSAVAYQTGDLHRVDPVTRGTRLACVGWMQSIIRTDFQRQILFDLERARMGAPEGEPRLMIQKAIGNLVRLWMEG